MPEIALKAGRVAVVKPYTVETLEAVFTKKSA